VRSAATSPDSTWLATNDDETARIWADAERELHTVA
jgi:hypothetical protein